MTNFAHLETDVMADEGFRSVVYQDIVDVWTIGFGTTRIGGIPVTENTPDMTEDVARDLLRADLYQALIDAQGLIPTWAQLNSTRQEVLANMAYNLGRRGLTKFYLMRSALQLADFAEAADQMLSSRWAIQVGMRAVRLAHQMRTGSS